MTKERIKDYTLKITNASPTGIIVIMYDLAIEYIEEAKKEILALTEVAPNEKFDKIERNLDNKLNVYSDEFGVNLKKTLKEVEEKDVFTQLVYNLTMAKVEEDFLKLGLPAEYKLNIKDESMKTNKEKTKSV